MSRSRYGDCQVSPDGKRIAFTAASAIWTVNIDGTEAQKLISYGFNSMPSWSPDSRKIYFRQSSSLTRLYSQTAVPNAPDLQLVKTFIIRIGPGGHLYIIEPSGAVTVSSDGLIAFACNDNQRIGLAGLYVMNDDGSDLTLILSLFPERLFDSPIFSPAGSQIYFFSIEKDSTGTYCIADLLKINVDGSGLDTIASLAVDGARQWYCVGKSTELFLTISPDGEKLLFNLPEGDFVSHLYMVNTDGSNLIQITSEYGVTDRYIS